MLEKIEAYILNTRIARLLIAWSKRILLPGFDKVPLYDVVIFFISQTHKVGLTDRAAAISFNVLMAIPAALIFFFTLIPFFPISSEITNELLSLTRVFAPNQTTYELVNNFLNDFLNTPRSGLLSVGFIVAVFYASNAVLGIMRSFNRSLIHSNKQTFLHERFTAVRITTMLILLVIATFALMVTQGEIFRWIMKRASITNVVLIWLIESVRWLMIVALVLFAIGFLYKYAPAITKRWKLASPGAIFATFLIVLFSFAFSFWVNNFGSYNKIYGSIGTVLIIMLLIYVSSVILLIGYELNVSIHSLKAMAEERQKHETEGEVSS